MRSRQVSNCTAWIWGSILFALFFIPQLSIAKENTTLLVQYTNSEVVSEILIPDHLDVNEAKSELERRFDVSHVEVQTHYTSSLIPNDPSFLEQWYLMQTNIPDVWDFADQKEEIIVAVLDTGVDINHPELRGNIWTNTKEIPGDQIDNDRNGYVDDVNGWDFVGHSNDPRPRVEEIYSREGIMHGTLISGIIAANGQNMLDGAGIAQNVKIMPIRVLDGSGHGEASSVINAINYARKNGADIINLSFVGNEQSSLMKQTLLSAYHDGILIVAAAGNNKVNGGTNLDEEAMYPICYDLHDDTNYILGVGSTDRNDVRSYFSNYGDCVDISAPGQDMYGVQYFNAATADFENTFGGPWAGTSLAVPVVSGTAAVLKSAYPNLTVDALTSILLSSSTPIDAIQSTEHIGKVGVGRVNAFLAAIQAKEVGNSLPKQSMIRSSELQSLSFFVAPQTNRTSDVEIFDGVGQKHNSLQSYDTSFKNGVRLASGDIDGDGKQDIITAPNVGGGPHVRVFSEDGNLITHFMAFDGASRSGAQIAACDIDGNGKDEVIVGAGKGMVPTVRVFHHKSKFEFTFTEFVVYDATYDDGVDVACSDIDGDELPEIVVGINNSRPHIRVFEPEGTFVSQFHAFDTSGIGVNVAACDLDDNGKAEIIVSQKQGGDPKVRVFYQQSNDLYQFTEFSAYGENFKGGVNIACGDVNRDGFLDILTGAGIGGGPHIRWFDKAGTVIGQIFSFKNTFRGGVTVGVF